MRDGRTDGRMDGWMDGWVGRWREGGRAALPELCANGITERHAVLRRVMSRPSAHHEPEESVSRAAASPGSKPAPQPQHSESACH